MMIRSGYGMAETAEAETNSKGVEVEVAEVAL
jgi:hypothetical protein